ncbi:FxLYD domain-containing protein [Candidatus Bipolaricaulota bacterium]|nr:FxLYD domain-containing protein [Candidatus Bipolaricaulota bacterium]
MKNQPKLLVVTITTILVFSVVAQADLEVTDWDWYKSFAGYAVYGEVKNTGDQTVTSVQCSVTWYLSGNMVATGSWRTWISKIAPGETVPFALQPKDIEGNVGEADRAELKLSWRSARSEPRRDVQILQSDGWVDKEAETYKIIGKVKNYEDQPAKSVVITATLYDSSGSVVGVGMGQANLRKIPPNNTSSFVISDMMNPAARDKVDDYDLDVQYYIER